MGWRQGKGVGPNKAAPDSMGAGRWGPEAGIGAENTPIYALPPKTDNHGLGFDPFKVVRTLHAMGPLKYTSSVLCASAIRHARLVSIGISHSSFLSNPERHGCSG